MPLHRAGPTPESMLPRSTRGPYSLSPELGRHQVYTMCGRLARLFLARVAVITERTLGIATIALILQSGALVHPCAAGLSG